VGIALIFVAALLFADCTSNDAPPGGFKDDFRKALKLRDGGDVKGAIAVFERLAKERPDDPDVLSELARAHLGCGEFEAAIDIANRAIASKVGRGDVFYVLLTGAYDGSRQWSRGEQVIRRGIQEYPDVAMLRFCLGLMLQKQGRLNEAVKALQDSLLLNPMHASSWHLMAETLADTGRRVPAVVAYVRFLSIEPESARSRPALQRLEQMISWGNEQPKKGDVLIEPPDKPDDPWYKCSLLLSTMVSLRHEGKGATMNDGQFFAKLIEGVSVFLDNFIAESNVEPFWKTQVVAYFDEAREGGYLEAMSWSIRSTLDDADTRDWVRTHSDALDRYRAWSAAWRPAKAGGKAAPDASPGPS
jgi:tetratricopeptide (TPR) repeat protein